MIRGVGLRSAIAINVATMIGAGPFITLPLVVVALHGSVSAAAWAGGALIALCDGLVWAELASRTPRSGGTYAYLREAFGALGAGRFFSFLFVWQYLFWAPLVIASGYIGFAQYAAYLAPGLAAPLPTHLVAFGVGLLTLGALYRPIPNVARTALVLGGVALVTLLAVALAGLTHPHAPLATTLPASFAPIALPWRAALPALGAALVITLYDYGGYGDVCALGDEVVAAARTIPRAIVISVLTVGAAYVLLNVGVVAALAPKEISASTAVASLVAERTLGAPFAVVVTLAVLVTAFGSTYGLLLGASRIPFAAARDGDFLSPFAKLHPRAKFPAVSLVTLGLLALPASLLPLDAVINALTAGIVLVQGAGQIVALGVARSKDTKAPFRVPLYPLPPLIALAGWLFLFWSTGRDAIAFGVGTLALGALVYFVRARISRIWPFAAATVATLLVTVAGVPATPAAAARTASRSAPLAARPPSFGHARIVMVDGEPQLRVDGRPFFFTGGAFFYERIPRARWRGAMLRMRAIGANTLDLYVPWNWHELADGDFDFDGRTSPRRDLREVLRLGKELGFYFVVRPGPVIRNEWRNGGYPAWLLRRGAYAMPLHDVLEGRYPATATLQNAHSDDAAGEWMRNATHLRYAARWLHRALEQFRPVADRVLAVQLDDDQGAYLDNDTYPAPHLHAYLRWLEARMREVVGPVTPAFINTFEMRVPSSSPVWTMGNWYQSDAFAIGEHDRAELAFATASLRTHEGAPLAYSEFQAGWLAGPDDPQPRPADPANTALALGELAGWGVKGVIDFPLLDTLAPFGWEAPFSNALYAWDAAIPLDPSATGDRWKPTQRALSALRFYGPALAEAHRVADVALMYDGRSDGFHAAAQIKADLAACRALGVACDAVDPLAVNDARLRSFRYAVAHADTPARFVARARRLGLRVVTAVADATGTPRVPDVSLLRGRHGTFLIAENWSDLPLRVDPHAYGTATRDLAPFIVAPRDARIAAIGVDLAFLLPRFARDDRLTTSCAVESAGNASVALAPATGTDVRYANEACATDATIGGRHVHELFGAVTRPVVDRSTGQAVENTFAFRPLPDRTGGIALSPHALFFPADTAGEREAGDGAPAAAGAFAASRDVFEDGYNDIVLGNASVRAVLTPGGGGRLVAFGPPAGSSGIASVVDATGALRDDVLVQPPPSPTDRIAKYTHLYPAGTFNRPYAACRFGDARAVGAYFAYDAPDVVPRGALFERVVSLAATAGRLVVDERFTPHSPSDDTTAQRLVSLSAFTTARAGGDATALDDGRAHPAAAATTLDPSAGGVSIVSHTGEAAVSVVRVSWRPGDVEAASWFPARSNGTLRLVLAPGGWHRLTVVSRDFPGSDDVRAWVEAERAWVVANPAPATGGEVAKRYTQSPQKRPSESSCGFESHLPYD